MDELEREAVQLLRDTLASIRAGAPLASETMMSTVALIDSLRKLIEMCERLGIVERSDL